MGPSQLVMMGSHSSKSAQPSSEAVAVKTRDSYVVELRVLKRMVVYVPNWDNLLCQIV